MKLRIAIFEDDQDLLELLIEMLQSNKYSVVSLMTLKNVDWENIDIVLGDYRNTIVNFNQLSEEAGRHGVPLIAISGGDMNYPYQLSKPFTIEELESLMFKLVKESQARGAGSKTKRDFLSKWINKIAG
jgi:DNA-binding NtrC family response regulator